MASNRASQSSSGIPRAVRTSIIQQISLRARTSQSRSPDRVRWLLALFS